MLRDDPAARQASTHGLDLQPPAFAGSRSRSREHCVILQAVYEVRREPQCSASP